MKRALAALAVSGLLALAACSGGDDDYAAVCVDQTTQQRVDDGKCPSDLNGQPVYPYVFWWYPVWAQTPPVGRPVSTTSGGTTTRPARTTTTRPPATGGQAKPGSVNPATKPQSKPGGGSNGGGVKPGNGSNGGGVKPGVPAPRPPAPAPRPPVSVPRSK